MSEANTATTQQVPAQRVITELKVSGHLMALDPGLFCIVQTPSRAADAATGMPGVRLSLPPGTASRPDAVTISTFRPDGFMNGSGDAALVRVVGGPAHVLVTIYQSPVAKDGAPTLQVLRLLDGSSAPVAAGAPAAAPIPVPAPPVQPPAVVAGQRQPAVMEIIAHIQGRGDVGAMLGQTLGEKGSKAWIEGFGIAPRSLLAPKDLEYQAVLGRGWLSPWVEGGQFCGSRGMALPILGLRVRVRGDAADAYEAVYSASFIDGTEIGPVRDGEPCEADSLAALESVHVELRPKAGANEPAGTGEPAAAVPVAADDVAEDANKPAKKGGRKPAGSRKR